MNGIRGLWSSDVVREESIETGELPGESGVDGK